MIAKPIAPMLASPMSKATILDWNDWVSEEKFDGWRVVAHVCPRGNVTAWTRERRKAHGGKDQSILPLPDHIVAELKRLAVRGFDMMVDGELLAIHPDGRVGTSTDVSRLDMQHALRYVVFDILQTATASPVTAMSYKNRRALLEALFRMAPGLGSVVLAETRPCVDADGVSAFCHEVWNRGGEGLILKNIHARYTPGKRPKDAFVKIKKLYTAVIKVTGFEATRGTVMNRGAFAKVCGTIVEAPEGHEALIGGKTSVKTRDDAALETFRREWDKRCKTLGPECHDAAKWGHLHPAIGRSLRIEYQDIAAEGGVRHPRWDRWEVE